jgi:hypothetical protein
MGQDRIRLEAQLIFPPAGAGSLDARFGTPDAGRQIFSKATPRPLGGAADRD